MNRARLETAVGTIVSLLILYGVFSLTRLGVDSLLGENSYHIYANFYSVSGLKSGASVEMAGVEVGSVNRITLDPKTLMARVDLKIKRGIKLQGDVVASVSMRGIMGDQYISLSPGKSAKVLTPGSVIVKTKPAIDIEELISEFIQGKV